MATGFCKAQLAHMTSILQNGNSYGGSKVTPPGFLNALLSKEARPNALQVAYSTRGHRLPTVDISYIQRSTEAQTGTALDCDIDVTPGKKEVSFTVTKNRQISMHVPDDTMRQYCADASNPANLNGIGTPLMQDFLELMYSQLNGLYQGINTDLVTSQATRFGVNRRTGSTSTTALNLTLAGTTMNVQDGIGRVITDMELNEICNDVFIVGNGNFHLWANAQMRGALGMNQSGVDNSRLMDALGAKFYFDQKTAALWGDNQIGVFDASDVQFIEYNRYVGGFAGVKGAVELGQFFDPRVQCWTPAGYQPMAFDIKLKYIDCPTSLTNGYAGGSQTYNEGWAVYISKTFDLFNVPVDMYDGGDPLSGNRGSLRYTVTNA